ncbi:MAG: helix-turn-helix domain-containing protein [bacterium]|nr:helix-turn-helix domain-containing protein [bacterium]MCY4272233.1 helix-turn-helix domain-containing protein [bacterium]
MSAAIASRLQVLQDHADLTQDQVGQIVGASARTVSRWERGHAAPQPGSRQRLIELAYVAETLAGVLKPEERNLWIFTPNRLLDHDSPADRIASGDYRSVVALIEALADGIVV